jgi:hypothetical protein
MEFSKRKFCHTCTLFGYFELAKWGTSKNCLIFNTISAAAKFPESHALPFMKWARSQGAKILVEAIKQAAERGSLEAIKWMVGEWEDRENGGEEGKGGETGKMDGERSSSWAGRTEGDPPLGQGAESGIGKMEILFRKP